ncbi:3-hydroxybutyrate oligomer hydrolase family protein [Streptomyces rubiginosohelvolus]|uniref:3-hydroxybutyrate oligomer hydrolase family protein n=1 Tax=Streptomyces rubiginosohelvolus TaxID=67362 RepID=UPI0033BD841B
MLTPSPAPPAPRRAGPRHDAARRSRRGRWLRGAAVAAAVLTAWTAAPSAAAPPDRDSGRHGHCARQDVLRVPGAARQQAYCLVELTTAGTVASGHTDPADWAGLTPEGLAVPRGVPGIQIDGHFPDTSTGNTNHGWNHDSQFVIRLPDRWNGGLVVAGSPGVREQYANDRAFGDWALAREELDPGFDGATEAGTPFCAPGTPACDADYAYPERPDEVRDAVAKIALTGRIGKPLISFHGTLDVLLPISRTSDTYARLVRQQRRGALHRYYRVEGGTRVDSLVDTFPDRLRPLVPCHRSAAAALERWLDDGRRPPSSRTLKLPGEATPAERLTRCPLDG